MKRILFLITFIIVCLAEVAADTVKTYVVSDQSLSREELLEGGMQIALRVWTTSRDMYISDGNNCAWDRTGGSTVFRVEAADGGIRLQNVKSGEYLGGTSTTLERTTDVSKAKVFTPVKITSKVANTHESADETRSYWLTFKNGGTTWYLNTNTNNYQTAKYATGNGNWSTMYIYRVDTEETVTTTIIPVPQKVVAGNGTLASWTEASIQTRRDETLGREAYILDITQDGISITSGGEAGEYYARQTLAQLAEQQQELPCMRIEDSPRFAYRGFMLDVSRHFFSVEEVKRMIDVMARYKMNVFHWHLTDDQGWRAEIKKYPKLTTVGATRSNNYDTPITQVTQNGQTYWTGVGGNTGKKYGPYYYTQDEMREVVAYAAERHIDVMPEVDMPGHFVAAMAAYPEYCCHPSSAPSVWTSGGISSDVLNVGNPQAVEFAQNILAELCDIFPYPYIHIGGDECPTSQWESNSACQTLYKELGLSSYRALQTHFIKQIADFVATKDKQLVCWNESVTASGANLTQMQETGATIMCWNPCQSGVKKAVEMGLPAIVTEYHAAGGGYYINRRQSNDYGEPSGAGYGDDTVEGCYNYVPVQNTFTDEQLALVRGVQGTFWTEHVGSNEYLEYLALPRLICVAEAGWARQEQKDWNDFRRRLTLHTEWLDQQGYIYGRHWMEGYIPRTDGKTVVTPEVSTVEAPKWYKIKFTNGGTYLQMNGTSLATTAADQQVDGQYFALIGTSTTNPSTSSFRLYSADGYWVSSKSSTATNGQSATLLYGNKTRANGRILCLQAYPSDASQYVISQTSDKTTGFNTWGGSGAGVNIGFYSISDANDKLVFQLEENEYIPTSLTDIVIDNAPATGVYDLQGRRAAGHPHGVYIVGGKKVVY